MTDQTWPIAAPGVWIEVRGDPHGAARPVLFLDRDGVIVEDNGFLCDPDAARLMPGAAQLVAAANRTAIPVAIVTNQSGIDRGLYGWAEFAAVQSRIESLLGAEGAAVDALAACPFHPDFTPGYGPQHAEWRKPGPAMLTALAAGLDRAMARSWLVGDTMRDIEAARAAGLAGAILLAEESAEAAAEYGPDTAGFEFLVAATVADAAELLRRHGLIGATE